MIQARYGFGMIESSEMNECVLKQSSHCTKLCIKLQNCEKGEKILAY